MLRALGLSRERRQYPRRSIQLLSDTYIGGVASGEGRIVDYSRQGLLVDFGVHNAKIPSLKYDAKIQLAFRILTREGKRKILLKGKLVRKKSATQFGLRLDKLDEVTYKILEKIALQTSDKKKKTESEHEHLQKPCASIMASLSHELSDDFFAEYFSHCQKLLASEGEKPQYRKSKEKFQDAISILRNKESTIRADVKSMLSEKVKKLYKDDDQLRFAGKTDAQLSAIKEDDFDSWLMVRSAATKFENLHSNLLHQVASKLSTVGASDYTSKSMPLAPQQILEVFLAGLREAKLEKELERLLWRELKHSIVSDILLFYKNLDSWLQDNGVVLKSQRLAPKMDASQPIVIDVDAILKECEKLSSTHTDSRRSSKSASKESSGKSSKTERNERVSRTRTQTTRRLAIDKTRIRSLRDVIKNSTHLSLRAVAKITDALHYKSSLGRRQRSPNELSSSELTQLIDGHIQEHRGFVSLSETIRQLSFDQKVSKEIASFDQELINFTDLFFDELQHDERLDEQGRKLINRLKLPAFKSLLCDENVFISDNSDFAKLISKLIELNRVNPPLFLKNYSQIAGAIDELTEAKISRQHKAIDSANHLLSSLLSQHKKVYEKNLKRVLSGCDGYNVLLSTQTRVDEKIDAITERKRIPKVFDALLSAGWRNLLVMAEMNEKEKIHLSAYWWVLEALSELAQNKGNDIVCRDLVKVIQRGLNSVSSSQTNAILKQLDKLLTYYEKGREPGADYFLDSKTYGQNKTKKIVTKAIGRYNDRIDQLKLGSEVTIQIDEISYHTKLVWYTQDKSQMTFVNEQGIKVVTLSRDKLAAALKSKIASIPSQNNLTALSRVNRRFKRALSETHF